MAMRSKHWFVCSIHPRCCFLGRLSPTQPHTPYPTHTTHLCKQAAMMLHQTHSAALHQSSSKAATTTRKPLVISAAAGGFGRSNKKKVDTSGGMVVPEKPFRNATLEDLRDDAPTKNKKSKTAEEGAPAGFPEGVSLALGGEVARLGWCGCLSCSTSQCSDCSLRRSSHTLLVPAATTGQFQLPGCQMQLQPQPCTQRISQVHCTRQAVLQA